MNSLLFVTLGAMITAILGWMKSRFADFLAQRPEDYVTPGGQVFDLREHLNGPIRCEGMIYGPTGRVTSRFIARFDCSWVGNRGKMIERFTYDDGSVADREWTLEVDDSGAIKAMAPDVVGVGSGTVKGAAVRLSYRFQLPASSGGHVLDTVDWMYLTPNGNIMNRSQFRKFGIKVAELVATMRPMTEEEAAADKADAAQVA